MIFSICTDWKSAGMPLPPCPPVYVLKLFCIPVPLAPTTFLLFLTSIQSLETFRSSFNDKSTETLPSLCKLNWLFFFLIAGSFSVLSSVVVSHLWFLRSAAVQTLSIEYFFISVLEKRCYMHQQMKSWHGSERRLNTLINVRTCLSGRSLLAENFLIVWIKQQLVCTSGSLAKNSSLIISRPPIAAKVSKIPRSNRSCFLSSLIELSDEKLLA